MDTATHPARIIAKYITIAWTVIGMSIAIASPFENVASTAFATNLQPMLLTLIEQYKKQGGGGDSTGRKEIEDRRNSEQI